MQRAREAAEWVLRAIAVALLAGRLLTALRPAAGTGEVARSADLRAALVRWTTLTAPARVHAAFDYPPTEVERDWLAALPGAGTAMTWTGPGLLPTALGVLPVADPAGGLDALVAAPRGVLVGVGDTAGRVDTTRQAAPVMRLSLARSVQPVTAAAGPVRARGAARDSLTLRRVLVLGSAGWESKFAVAALEERGWTVDAHLVVAPGADVAQGALVAMSRAPSQPSAQAPSPMPGGASGMAMLPGAPPAGRLPIQGAVSAGPAPAAPPPLPKLSAIDTARYSAVLALDTTAAREAPRLARFVRSGGGLVLTAAAADAPGLRTLAPGRGDAIVQGETQSKGPTRREALPIRPLVGLPADAVVLERRGGHVVTSARREGVGRVVLTGQEEFWRWRMGGPDSGPEEHRAWLARLVAGVARTPVHSLDVPAFDPAPVATLVDHLGPAVSQAPNPAPPGDPRTAWTFAAIAAAVLLEWLSRRLRSQP
ncbi:MAG TPA: hypothetical protein VJQ44_14355 [Gemmatimonadales bacterium]|nr:hypothetical protein [Gemmatimonadales bacterium]